MELSILEQKILRCLSYFDLLDYPLTALEIKNNLEINASVTEVITALNSNRLDNLISQKQGLYFLTGRENLVMTRLTRYRLSVPKLKKIHWHLTWLRLLPWIRAVAIFSSLSLKNVKTESDIDLFIITAKNRVWSLRFFLNIILKLFHLRPTDRISQDKLCASYLIDEAALDLSNINLPGDYYYYYGTAAFNFLYSEDNLAEKFFQSSPYLNNLLPNWQPIKDVNLKSPNRPSLIKKISERILSPLSEKFLQKWQMRILPKKYLNNQFDGKVVLGEHTIKLHANDCRKKFNEEFEGRYQKLIAADGI